jgi:hypothetical protein
MQCFICHDEKDTLKVKVERLHSEVITDLCEECFKETQIQAAMQQLPVCFEILKSEQIET